MSLQNLSAKQLCDKIATGQIGSVEATEVVFKNIDEREPVIGAFMSTYRDRVLEKAAEVDKRIAGGEMENF
jgi:Asp-tRNA(Asn)/Glu-tRNA(Gln) amidotransferase A subunit family amidase